MFVWKSDVWDLVHRQLEELARTLKEEDDGVEPSAPPLASFADLTLTSSPPIPVTVSIYCRTPDQTKIKSIQTENLERLYNCLGSFLLACHAENSSDVTLAFEDAD